MPIEKDVLILIPEKNEIIQKSARNLPFVKTMLVNYLNIADLQRYDQVVFLEKSLRKMEEIFTSNTPAKEVKEVTKKEKTSKSKK